MIRRQWLPLALLAAVFALPLHAQEGEAAATPPPAETAAPAAEMPPVEAPAEPAPAATEVSETDPKAPADIAPPIATSDTEAPPEEASPSTSSEPSAPTEGGGPAPVLSATAASGAPAVSSEAEGKALLAKMTSEEPGEASALGKGKDEKAGGSPFDLFKAAGDWGKSLRASLAGNPVTLTDKQREALQGMRPALVGLAGPDGMFNRADMPDVLSSLRGELGGRVQEEIGRRADAKINEGRFPRLRAPIVNAVVNRNYCDYFSQGMQQANGMVTSGMEQFFDGTGVENTAAASSQPTARNLTLAQLDGFKRGAETLREIDKQRNAKVKVNFPGGFGVADLDSILADPNHIPPNGRIGPRR